jgi:hypothetical protein
MGGGGEDRCGISCDPYIDIHMYTCDIHVESDNKSLTNQLTQMDLALEISRVNAAFEVIQEDIRASRRRRALLSGLENLRPSRRALRVCLILLKENDLLYIPALPGADFDPTDLGISDEVRALELALCLYYRPPLPPPPPVFSTLPNPVGHQYTYEELEAML